MADRGWFTGAVEGSGDFGPEPRHLQTSGSQRCHSCSAMVTPDHANCPQCGPAFPVASALEDCDLRERLERALGSKFEVRALIGRGGFADVYEIFDCQLERPLAVKVLRPEITKAPWLADRFEKETRALASLFHLNIPPIHFVGDNEGLVYYVMPLIQGRSLGAIMEQEGALGADTLADLMIPVLEALEHAHQHGIIHRDIKPDNIIIDEESGRPLLVDFGVAKYSAQELGSADGSTTLPGMILGTPGYISPEQTLGNPVDGRSDVYSMGSTMFHLLTGVTTFAGDSPRSIIGRQITEEAPIPAAMNAPFRNGSQT